jgi:hypothetical protein
VTLRGLRFHLPRAKYPTGRLRGLQSLAAAAKALDVSIGVHPVQCAVLTVENCLFRYQLDPNNGSFGAGIFAQGECRGHRIRNNRFVRDDEYPGATDQPIGALYGYLLVETLQLGSSRTGVMVPAVLQDGEFEDNLFSGLAAAVVVFAPVGRVEFESNTVRNCFSGVLLGMPPIHALGTALSTLSRPEAERVADLAAGAIFDPVVQVGSVLGRSYPLPEGVDVPGTVAVDTPDDTATADTAAADTAALLTALAGSTAPAPTGDSAAAPEQPLGKTAADEILRQLGERAAAAAAGLGIPPKLYASFAAAQDALGTLQKAAAEEVVPHKLHMSLHVSGDDVDTRPGSGEAGVGLQVLGAEPGDADITMVGSRYIARSKEVVVTIWNVAHAAVSGNVVVNEYLYGGGRPGFAMSVTTTAAERFEGAAVTGNVFRGRTQFPPRPLSAPLDTWDVLNAHA